MEKCSSEIFRQKFITYCVVVFFIAEFLINCSAPKEKTILKSPTPAPKFRGIQVVEKSDSVTYYELPDTIDDIDPESISTFKTRIKNKALIEKIQSLVKNGTFTYTVEKSKRCLPAYSAAIVFRKSDKKSVVLFSFHCSVLKVLEENLYLNFDDEKNEIEKLFKEKQSETY